MVTRNPLHPKAGMGSRPKLPPGYETLPLAHGSLRAAESMFASGHKELGMELCLEALTYIQDLLRSVGRVPPPTADDYFAMTHDGKEPDETQADRREANYMVSLRQDALLRGAGRGCVGQDAGAGLGAVARR